MMDVFLTEPDIRYEKSFRDYAKAYQKSGEVFYYDFYSKALDDFQAYVDKLIKNSKGIDVAEGWVPTSSFWLIHHEQIVGIVRVRHQEIAHAGHIGYDISPQYRRMGYGSTALRLALEKASALGLPEVILTCEVNNAASRNIIEKNNGKLLHTIFDEEENCHLYKYSITLTD